MSIRANPKAGLENNGAHPGKTLWGGGLLNLIMLGGGVKRREKIALLTEFLVPSLLLILKCMFGTDNTTFCYNLQTFINS